MNFITLMHNVRNARNDEMVLSVWQDFSINQYFFSLLCENPNQIVGLLGLIGHSTSFVVFETIYSDIKRQNYGSFHGQVETNPQRFRSILVQLINSECIDNFSSFIQYLTSHNQLQLIQGIVGVTDQSRRNVFHLAAIWSPHSGLFDLINAIKDDRSALTHLNQCDAYGKTPLYYFSIQCKDDELIAAVMQLLCSIGIDFAIKHFFKKHCRTNHSGVSHSCFDVLSQMHQKAFFKCLLEDYFFVSDNRDSHIDYQSIIDAIEVKNLSAVIQQLPALKKQHNLVESRLSALLEELSQSKASTSAKRKYYHFFPRFNQSECQSHSSFRDSTVIARGSVKTTDHLYPL